MFSFFTLNFVIFAIIISLIVSVSSALLSPYLVLDEQALIADGLAHVSFTGIVLGVLLINEPLFISIPFTIIFSVLIKYLIRNKNINGDASLGLFSAISLAIGLIIIHKSSGFNQSIETMLVGSLWTVNLTEIIIALVTLILITIFVLLFYNDLMLLTFDLKYAKFKKIKHVFLSYSLAILTAILITIGVKTIGTLLISSFVIFPVLIGKEFNKGFKITHIIGIISSIISVLFGIIFAHFVDIPAGSSIVITYTTILFITMIYNKVNKRRSFRG